MKVHEYLASNGPELLLQYVSVAGMAAQTASALKGIEEPNLAETFLDIVQNIVKDMESEAKIRKPTLASYFSTKPITLAHIIKAYPDVLDSTVKNPKLKLYREAKRLVDAGILVRTSQKRFALAPPPESTPETETEPESMN